MVELSDEIVATVCDKKLRWFIAPRVESNPGRLIEHDDVRVIACDYACRVVRCDLKDAALIEFGDVKEVVV